MCEWNQSMFIAAEAQGQQLHYAVSSRLSASLPASELVELSPYFRQSNMGVYVLDSMELLELARKVPVHNFHLFL